MPNLKIDSIKIKVVGRKFLEETGEKVLKESLSLSLPSVLHEAGLSAPLELEAVRLEFRINHISGDHWGLTKHAFLSQDYLLIVIDSAKSLFEQTDFIMALLELFKNNKETTQAKILFVLTKTNFSQEVLVTENDVMSFFKVLIKKYLNALSIDSSSQFFTVDMAADGTLNSDELGRSMLSGLIASRSLQDTIATFKSDNDALLKNIKEQIKKTFETIYLGGTCYHYNPLRLFTRNNHQRGQEILQVIESATSVETIQDILESQKNMFMPEPPPLNPNLKLPEVLKTPITVSYNNPNESGCYRAIEEALVTTISAVEGLEYQYLRPS